MEYYNIINSKYLSLCKSQALVMKFKIELLDHYENTIGEITSKISNTGGSINIKYNQGVRRTCDITVDNANINYLPNNEFSPLFVNKKFKIYTGITETGLGNKDGDVFWFSQGIFITTSSSYDDKTKVLSLQGVDKFGFFTKDLNQHTLQVAYKIPVGTRLDKLISDIITLDMGNGMPTDPISPVIHSSLGSQEIPYDIEKSANETIGDILVELATAFNADICYDVNGHLVFEPNIIDDYYRQSPVYEFTNGDASLITSSLNYDYSNIVNQITVMGNNTDGAIYSSTAKNENPNSSLRISNIGVKASDIEETAMGYNEKRCYDYANYLLKKKMRMAASGTIECTPLPHLDCNRIIRNTINDDEIKDVDFLIEEVQLSLGTGTYSLSVCNLQELPVSYFSESIATSSNFSNWILFTEYPSLGKYVNRGGETFVVAPAIVNGVSVTSIGSTRKYGVNIKYELEDGDIITPTSNNGFVKGLQSVTNLYIEDGIINIKGEAFSNVGYGQLGYNYNDIETIRFPNTLRNIDSYSFEYCFLDKEIVVIPSYTTISTHAFAYSNIKSVVINSSCNLAEKAFAYCYNLNDVTIKGNSTLGDYCFYECCSLESVDLGNVEAIPAGCFQNCYNLENIIIPDSVMEVGGGAFVNTALLNNQTGIKYADTWIIDCDANVTSIEIGDNVKGIVSGVFNYCTAIKNITVDENHEKYSSIDGVLFNKDKTELIQYPLGNKRTEYIIPNETVNIFYGAFQDCYSLESITIPDSVTSIGGSAFRDCTALFEISIGNNVVEIQEFTFFGCDSLTDVIIPDSVTSIGKYAFGHCENLQNITIKNPNCEIYDDDDTISSSLDKFNGTILGYENSTAQTYAEKYSYNFIAIE